MRTVPMPIAAMMMTATIASTHNLFRPAGFCSGAGGGGIDSVAAKLPLPLLGRIRVQGCRKDVEFDINTRTSASPRLFDGCLSPDCDSPADHVRAVGKVV